MGSIGICGACKRLWYSDGRLMWKHFIFDVDGVLTTGQFLYTSEGKFAKIFGPHDADGIKLIRGHLELLAITADQRGEAITRKRIEEDMGIPVVRVPEQDRVAYLRSNFTLAECVYMGDSMFDALLMPSVGYAIAPANAWSDAKAAADYVTIARGGEGAVAEACLHVLAKIGVALNLNELKYDTIKQLWR